MKGFAALLIAFMCGPALAADWYSPPGVLTPGSGSGVTSETVYYPNLRFPIENAPAFLNSQVYRPGGGQYNGSLPNDQCHPVNYDYKWEDTFCEKRSRDTPMCPSGKGHQGVDIRASTCVANRHWAVAGDDGLISHIGTYSVTLQTNGGARLVYLHLKMSDLAVRVMQKVKKGDRIGKVSNDFGGTPTTRHLHFEIRDSVRINGQKVITPVPPYTSLVAAYADLAGLPE